jgi:hypothetical protein
MKNQSTQPQIDIERAEKGRGPGSSERLEPGSEDGKKEEFRFI